MKEEALSIARPATSPAQKMNLLREYVQAFALRSLHESEAFLQLSFVGGTALRFLFDLPSLMAGKIHALLTRPYAKGRDWYDLLWYLGRRPPVEPNLALLQDALVQTGHHDVLNTDWRQYLCNKLRQIDQKQIAEDVAPFLERPPDAALLTTENLQTALQA